jgi:uncharacterized protein YgiB involved in biofilm formation
MSMFRLVSACVLCAGAAVVMTWVCYESAPAVADSTPITYPSALACIETNNLRSGCSPVSLG